jgi:hypothetical protein
VKVDLLKCARCSLRWVDDDCKKACPRCSKQKSEPTILILAGQRVEVGAVRLFGEKAMADPSGLDVLNLGMRCSHGYIHPSLCESCSE